MTGARRSMDPAMLQRLFFWATRADGPTRTFPFYLAANMKQKVKVVKKEDRNGAPPPVEGEAPPDPKEWSTAVKSWVKEFQEDRREGSAEAFDSLFNDSKPKPS